MVVIIIRSLMGGGGRVWGLKEYIFEMYFRL